MSSFYIGIDLGGTNVRAGVVTEDGRVLSNCGRATEVSKGQDHSVGQIIGTAKDAVAEAGLSKSSIAGVGIGSPGPLDPFNGLVLSPVNFPTWGTVPLARIMSDEFGGVPAALDNDANVVAYGENWLGAGKDTQNFLCMTLGTGVGGGVVCEGHLLHGHDGNAAEVGHICIDYNGPRCACGGIGCLELYCSATGIARRTKAAIETENPKTSLKIDAVSAHTIADAARTGDEFAGRMYEETGFFLGIGIVSAVALYNSEIVAIGGGMARAGDLILDPARRTFRTYGFPSLREKLRIEPMRLGDDAAILGAAKLVIDGGVIR
jgi:glucokinase